jgi:hypothetical protein
MFKDIVMGHPPADANPFERLLKDQTVTRKNTATAALIGKIADEPCDSERYWQDD